MQGAAEFALPLDVHHLAVAQRDPGRDAAGLAETGLAQRENGQAINLAHSRAINIDAHRVSLYGLHDPVLGEAGSVPALRYCPLDVLGANGGEAILSGPIVRHGQEVGDMHYPGGQLVLVFHHPGGIVHQNNCSYHWHEQRDSRLIQP